MKKWPYKIQSLSPHRIRKAVSNVKWQQFRLSLKGLPTEEKLDRLADWRERNSGGGYTRVQVDNYLNALKRGGQLDMQLRVAR